MTRSEPYGNTWKSMCVTHGMPCVNMHATFEAYIYGAPIQFVETSKGGENEEEGKRGKEERRREREEKKKMKEENRIRKQRKRGKKIEGFSRSEETQTVKNSELRYER